MAAALAAVTVFGDTVEEREKRTDEIAQWLPAEPKADGARKMRDWMGTDPPERTFYRAFRDFNPVNDLGIE